MATETKDKNKKESFNFKKEDLNKKKFFSLIAVSPRDKNALKMIYRNYTEEHTLRVWMVRLEKEGFAIANKEKLNNLLK